MSLTAGDAGIAAPRALDPRRILLAGRRELLRHGLALLLKEIDAGADVVEASSIPHIHSVLLTDDDFEIVLLDADMADDLQAAVAAIAKCAGRASVVVLADVYDPTEAAEAMEAEARGYLMWGSSAEVLVRAVNYVASGETYVQIPRAKLAVARSDRDLGAVAAPATEESDGQGRSVTPRQLAVAECILAGDANNQEIADRLGMAPNTVKVHVNALIRATGAQNRREAALLARAMAAQATRDARSAA